VAEKSCLITTSLIGSIEWYKTAPDTPTKADPSITWAQKARVDLENTLNRVYETNEAAERGNEFEKKLYSVANKIKPKTKWGVFDEDYDLSDQPGSKEFKQMLAEVAGGIYQKNGKMKTEIAGEQCLLFGRYDVWYEDRVKDVKTTGNYKKGKYLNTFQHILYLYLTGYKKFEYNVAEWDEYPKIKRVYKETFEIGKDMSEKELKINVEQTVAEALDFLKNTDNYWELYKNNFCLY